MVEDSEVKVTMYSWGGSWGPFRIKVPCGECSLTRDVIRDTLEDELRGIPVKLEIFEWLSNWWRPLRRGGWHAPIVMVGEKVISQGTALNRGILTQAVIERHSQTTPIEGSHLFGKAGCPHCDRGKKQLETAGIAYTYHDVVQSPKALYEMLARVKPLIGPKTPVTVPQIWVEGEYVGGGDRLEKFLAKSSREKNSKG